MIYPLLPVPLYTGELEPRPGLETRSCSSCHATFTTRRPGPLCFTCHTPVKRERHTHRT